MKMQLQMFPNRVFTKNLISTGASRQRPRTRVFISDSKNLITSDCWGIFLTVQESQTQLMFTGIKNVIERSAHYDCLVVVDQCSWEVGTTQADKWDSCV